MEFQQNRNPDVLYSAEHADGRKTLDWSGKFNNQVNKGLVLNPRPHQDNHVGPHVERPNDCAQQS